MKSVFLTKSNLFGKYYKKELKATNFLSLFAPIFLGLSVGIQWMTTSFLIMGLHPRPRSLEELTDVGKYWFRPEYDIGIYILGCFIALLLALTLSLIWQRNIGLVKNRRKVEVQIAAIRLICIGLLSYFMQVILILLFKNLILEFWKQTVFYELKVIMTGLWLMILVFPSSIALILTYRMLQLKNYIIDNHFKVFNTVFQAIVKLSDLAIPLLIITLIYIPDWQSVAGKIYLNDQFLHWDGFAIRLALAFRHGLVLGRDIFVQYGVGWPILLSFLNSSTQLLYGKMIHISIVYACIYYVGVYLLLRVLTQDVLWSAIGMALILFFQLFARNYPLPFLWETPSSTILRAPMDIWFFIILLLIGRAKSMFWKIMAAIFVGLAILFGFDTGFYLAVVFIFYSFVSFLRLLKRDKSRIKIEMSVFIITITISFLVIVSGLAVVGKLSVFQPKFWLELLEGIFEYGSGVSSLPMATLNSNLALITFELFIFIYLLGVGYWLIKFLRLADNQDDLFMASLSLYGLFLIMIFVTRSHRLNILYPSIPFWILITWIIAKTYKSWYIYLENRLVKHLRDKIKFIKLMIPIIMVMVSWTILFINPAFQSYPNLINSLINGPVTDGVCLMREPKDICGLTDSGKQSIEEYRIVVSFMQVLKSQGKRIAVFDDQDSLFYLSIDSYPWFRYRPGEVFTKKQLTYIHGQILNQRPNYILIKPNQEVRNNVIRDTRSLISQHYRQTDTLGAFEVWTIN